MVAFMVASEQHGKDDFEKFFITTAEDAARAILRGVRRNSRRVLIGRDARAADWLARTLPVAYQALALMRAHGGRRGKVSGKWRLIRFLYGPRHGVFSGIAREWLRFFKPGFHPWDQDNRRHLARIDGLIAQIDAANAQHAAKAAPRGVPLHPGANAKPA